MGLGKMRSGPSRLLARYAVLDGRSGRVTGTYEKLVPGLPYILAYEIVSRPEGELIAILHVLHGARDWPVTTMGVLIFE